VGPAGSGRGERLDPFAFPLRFEVAEQGGDERMPLVKPDCEGLLLRRPLHGVKLVLNLPLAVYRGVAIRMEPPTGATAAAVAVVLEHPDPGLSLTLYRAAHCTDIVAEWRRWGRALGVPLLVTEADGRLREPFERIGAVGVGRPVSRRRRRSSLKTRRPALPLRRRQGAIPARPVVHRGERELIARS
jgi:hypothetical protein